MLIVARTVPVAEAPKRTHGISLFMVDVNRQGLSHTAIDKVGTNTLPSSSVFFDDLRVEPEELLGTEHEGWRQLLDVLNTERIVTAAGLPGPGRLAIGPGDRKRRVEG